MKIGLLARADNTGLGVQTWEFYRAMRPERTMVVDISNLNGNPLHLERYPDLWHKTDGFPTPEETEEFVDGLDLVFTCETPYEYALFRKARERGVRSVLQYNFEFLDYLVMRDWPVPDLLAAPTTWYINDLRLRTLGVPVSLLPVPVALDRFPYRKRREAKRFLHIAGKKTYEDRNGTRIVLEAMRYVRSPIELEIWSQDPLEKHLEGGDPVEYDWQNDGRISVRSEDRENYWEGYEKHDVLLLPRRYGGLCLPLNEALASGMPVLMPDIAPQKDVLPPECLMPPLYAKLIMTRGPIGCFTVTPMTLATKIEGLVHDPGLVETLSKGARAYGEAFSWEAMRPVYESVFEALCAESR